MTPETPPSQGSPEHPRGDPRFGPEAAASVERSLLILRDPDDALRLLAAVEQHGAAFAAYLLLEDTNLAAEDLTDSFHDHYVDAWEQFAEFRRDVLEGLGWLDAVQKVQTEQAIPDDHLLWNHTAIDRQILETYDAIHLDGWWHIFNK